jgi:hypothetical protein
MLEESLERFEDGESEVLTRTSSLAESLRGESEGINANSQNAPSDTTNPSSSSQITL